MEDYNDENMTRLGLKQLNPVFRDICHTLAVNEFIDILVPGELHWHLSFTGVFNLFCEPSAWPDHSDSQPACALIKAVVHKIIPPRAWDSSDKDKPYSGVEIKKWLKSVS